MRSRQAEFRAAGLLTLLAAAGAAGCGRDAAEPAAAAPLTDDDAAAAAVWATFRDAFVNKEWEAAWGHFTPAAQEAVAARFDTLRREAAAGSPERVAQLNAMGLRPADLQAMDAKGFFIRSMRHLVTAEHLRPSWEKLRGDMAGSRVISVRRRGDEAVLVVRDGAGKETSTGARRVGGAWRVDFQAGP